MSNSQGEVRTALVEFLTAATKILKAVTPLIDEQIKKEMPVKVAPAKTARKPLVTPIDDDEVPL